jgi:hypothetical protein
VVFAEMIDAMQRIPFQESIGPLLVRALQDPAPKVRVAALRYFSCL